MRATAARIGVGIVAAAQAEVGVWGELAPHSFFARFPGAGHHWVRELGTYNEHLVRDYAACELGLAVLLACAVVWWERRLMLIAGAAFLAATVPHMAYHLTTTKSFSSTDNAASLGAFAIEIAIVLLAMALAARPLKGGLRAPNPRSQAARL